MGSYRDSRPGGPVTGRIMGSFNLPICTRIGTMNRGCSTSPGSDFADASRNHPLPRRAAERAPPERFMESLRRMRLPFT